MRRYGRTIVLVLLSAGALASCSRKPPSEEPVNVGGAIEYSQSRVQGEIACGNAPIVLRGDRTVMTLTGACKDVTVAGDHNDITVQLAPGGQVVASGDHNDITWSQSEPGAPPVLSSPGGSNTFHAPQ